MNNHCRFLSYSDINVGNVKNGKVKCNGDGTLFAVAEYGREKILSLIKMYQIFSPDSIPFSIFAECAGYVFSNLAAEITPTIL